MRPMSESAAGTFDSGVAAGRVEARGAIQGIAAAFLFAHDLVRYPTAEQWRWLMGPYTTHVADEIFRRLELPARGLALPATLERYESEYIAAFDAGAPHPLVPLVESHYNKREPVPRILHENILFHRAFGLALRDTAAETSDHLRHQLEFTAHLFTLEASASGETLEAVRRGRTEFAERHLLSWLPQAAEKARTTRFPWTGAYLDLALALAKVAAV